MPTTKQMEKMAAVGSKAPPKRAPVPNETMPPEYWKAVLADAQADGRQVGKPIQSRRLSDIGRHVLRVACRRCERIVEIQTADAVRLYGPDALWKDVGQRVLDNACQVRTGRYEEDGCWPRFE